MLDIVEAKVQARQVRKMFKPRDVRYQVVVEVEILECLEIVWEADFGYLVLSEA